MIYGGGEGAFDDRRKVNAEGPRPRNYAVQGDGVQLEWDPLYYRLIAFPGHRVLL